MICEFRKLLKYTGSGLQFVTLLLLRSPFDFVFTLIQATFLQNVFNAIEQNDAQRLNHVCLILGVASILLFLYNGIVWSIYAPFITKLESKLRKKLFCKISSLSYQQVESVSHGEWITQLNADVEMPFSHPYLPHGACSIVNLFTSSFILWKINPRVLGWVILFIVPNILISQLLIARTMPILNRMSLEVKAHNTNDLTTIITCADVTALYEGHDFLMKNFEHSSLELYHSNMKIHTRNAINDGLLALFGLGGFLTLLIVSTKWIALDEITFGSLTAVFQYRIGMLLGTQMLINCLITMQSAMAGIKRISKTLNEEGCYYG